jgi:UDP-N-acetylmuramoyl-tripeptide--D-alanyl-D-alanine ligase
VVKVVDSVSGLGGHEVIRISALELGKVLSGRVENDSGIDVTGSVETDSRLVTSGGIFFAKKGENEDGHSYVEDAKARGAVLAVVERIVDVEITQIVVANTLEALGELASWLIVQLKSHGSLRVVGITGSNGKTTTKNMLREILSEVGTTIAPIESFNNKVGAPISILRADLETEFLVVEMGAEGVGSIAYLARMAHPDVAAILKVGMAHAGVFGGIDNTAKIKAELAQELSEDSVIFLNHDDPMVVPMSKRTKAKVKWFGTNSQSDFWASDINLSMLGTSFHLNWPDGTSSPVQLSILGEHHVMNALAAAAVATELGASREQVARALEKLELAERWRMQRSTNSKGVTVINDAYNASPDSTKAALQTLAQLGRLGSRTVAVLGEMAELGEYSIQEHDAIGRLVVRLNIDQLVVVGEAAKLIHMGASQEGSWDGESRFFPSIDEALEYLRGILTDGDTVLVKSSKSANLRFLGDQLMEADK